MLSDTLWVTPQANLYRVVADEVEGDVKMSETIKSKEQKDQMDRLSVEFGETVTKTVGKNVETVHTMNTGEHQPVRSHQNRIAPAWKSQLQGKVFDMMKSGTLVPGQSPWS